jgi:hypothetical protein
MGLPPVSPVSAFLRSRSCAACDGVGDLLMRRADSSNHLSNAPPYEKCSKCFSFCRAFRLVENVQSQRFGSLQNYWRAKRRRVSEGQGSHVASAFQTQNLKHFPSDFGLMDGCG